MVIQVKNPRMIVRLSVRLRKEGGSISLIVPRYIVRRWGLEPGQLLVVKSTEDGILLFPRAFQRVVHGPEVPDQERTERRR